VRKSGLSDFSYDRISDCKLCTCVPAREIIVIVVTCD
jgi:hypothetical protein